MSDRWSVRKVVTLVTLSSLLAVAGTLHAQTKPVRSDVGDEAANSFLWVGNSFFY